MAGLSAPNFNLRNGGLGPELLRWGELHRDSCSLGDNNRNSRAAAASRRQPFAKKGLLTAAWGRFQGAAIAGFRRLLPSFAGLKAAG
jgi:hypothetical protein